MSLLELEWAALKSQRGEEVPLVQGLGGQFCRELLVFRSPLEGARSSLHCWLISPSSHTPSKSRETGSLPGEARRPHGL